MMIHLLVPSFPIAVEEQRRPEIRSQPVVMGGAPRSRGGSHSVVRAANSLAADYGICPGMALSQAYHLCPEAVFLVPDTSLYETAWGEVLAILRTYTPLVEPLGEGPDTVGESGEVVCDVTGCERLFGDPAHLARRIAKEIEMLTGLPGFLGVGSNRLVAGLAARSRLSWGAQHIYDPVSIVEPGQEAVFLAPLSIAALPDLDPSILLSFQVLGLKTIGQLARLSVRALEYRFGSHGKCLALYARGEDDRPVLPPSEEPSVAVNRRLDDADDMLELARGLSDLIERLANDLAAELQSRRLTGRLLTLTLTWGDQRSVEAQSGRWYPADRSFEAEHIPPAPFPLAPPGPISDPPTVDQPSLPLPGGRIHSMLPHPTRSATGDPAPRGCADGCRRLEMVPRTSMTLERPANGGGRRSACMETRRSLNDARTLTELGRRLLQRIAPTCLQGMDKMGNIELCLEMSSFAPPAQLSLPGMLIGDGKDRPVGSRNPRSNLRREEEILASRFGETPFRHVGAIDSDAVFSERRFRWIAGIGPHLGGGR